MSFFGTNRNWNVPLPDPVDDIDVVEALAESQEPPDVVPLASDTKPRRRKPKPDQAVQAVDEDQDQASVTDLDKRLRSIARRIKTAHKRTVGCVLEMGAALIEAQDLLADSEAQSFTAWLRDSVPVSRQTAYRFMQAARWVGGCDPQLQAKFGVEALNTLAAPSVPDQARQEALRRAKDGETITGKVAREILAGHKPAKPGKPKAFSVVVGGGAVIVRSKPGVDPVAVLESALAELRSTRKAAA